MADHEPSNDPLPGFGAAAPIDISSLRGGLSPRLAGGDPAHAAQLAALTDELPPIVVQRSTMRVVDGAHRLQAARLRGDATVPAVFFDGGDDEAFVAAVRLNIRHGKPLTSRDRAAAATRILATHPQWSDRWIASVCGVSPRTVAALRKRSTDDRTRLDTRLGQDGRRRPVSALDGRRRATEVMLRRPEASLREVAREAGISVGTASAVRRQLAARETAAGGGPVHAPPPPPPPPPTSPPPAPVIRARLERLSRDPSLRYTERGRALLRLLSATLAFVTQADPVADQMPGHCREALEDVARACAQAWHGFGDRLSAPEIDIADSAA